VTPRLALLWRGPLESCNYACGYCPFAKSPPVRATLDRDREALARFVEWTLAHAHEWNLEVLFTPFGEALIWPWYRDAIVRLSTRVRQVSIQTNGTAPMAFLDEADRDRVSLWISWHPTEIGEAEFAAAIDVLHARGTRLSVGAVAVPEHLERIERLRRRLPPEIPMWINAQKPGVRYRDPARWLAIDPAFEVDAHLHRSLGRECLTGEDTISVDEQGNIRRCHFVDEVIGNLYTGDLRSVLRPRVCPRMRCDCWIGYSNMPELDLRRTFAEDGRLARIRAAKRL
jgi:MoaA/NifB/PqqE/SkfB family radical SAM enzyme